MHADLMEYAESAARIDKSEATRLGARARRVRDKVAEGRDRQQDEGALPWRATWLVRVMRAC